MNRKLPLCFIFCPIVRKPNVTSEGHEYETGHNVKEKPKQNREPKVYEPRLHPKLTTRHRVASPVDEVLTTEVCGQEYNKRYGKISHVRLGKTSHGRAPLCPNDLHDHGGHDTTKGQPLKPHSINVESTPRFPCVSKQEACGKDHDSDTNHDP